MKNANGEWAVNPNGSTGTFTSGYIKYAQILCQPNITYGDNYSRDFVLRHEMGHVLGLGHTDSSTTSIMNTNGVTNSLSTHDTTDLANFY